MVNICNRPTIVAPLLYRLQQTPHILEWVVKSARYFVVLLTVMLYACAYGDPTVAGVYIPDCCNKTNAQRFSLDDGTLGWRIDCDNSMSGCYERANLLCPAGFISREADKVGVQSTQSMLLYSPFLGAYQTIPGRSTPTFGLFAVCKSN